MHQPCRRSCLAQQTNCHHRIPSLPGYAITAPCDACTSTRRIRLLEARVPTHNARSITTNQSTGSTATRSFHVTLLTVLPGPARLQHHSHGKALACRYRRDDGDDDLQQSDLLDDTADRHGQHLPHDTDCGMGQTSHSFIYSSSNISKPDLIRIMEAGGVISPQSASPPASMQSAGAVAEVAAAPPLAAENLEVPPNSLSLQTPRQLIDSAIKSLGNPLEPSPTAAAAVDGEVAESAAATDTENTLPPADSLSFQKKEQIVGSAAAAAQQVIEVGSQAVAEVTDNARSAIFSLVVDLLAASSAGAVSRRDFEVLNLGPYDCLKTDPGQPNSNAVEHAAAGSSRSGDVAASAAAAATGYQNEAPFACIAVSANSATDTAAGQDTNHPDVYIDSGSSSGSSSSSSSGSGSNNNKGSSSPLANLERSRIEVTNYWNDKREAAAQKLMKQTNVFANRLRESAKQTAHEMGPPVTKAAVAVLGRTNVVDAVKLLGRGNTAVAVGAVGGENAAAATEQLGVGGFAEVSETLGPKGIWKAVKELGPKGNIKLARKLVVDNADKAVSKMRESVRDPACVGGFMQRCVVGVLWWACFLWFGSLAVMKGLCQGMQWAAACIAGSISSSKNTVSSKNTGSISSSGNSTGSSPVTPPNVS